MYKPPEEFYIRKLKGKEYSASYCKKCHSATAKRRKATNPEKYSRISRLSQKPYLIYRKDYCELCGFIPIHECQLDVDHIDNNHKNNELSNLQTLCANCHRLKSRVNRMKDPVRKDKWLQECGFPVDNA